MKKYNLLKSLPKPKRNVKKRESLKTNFHIDISRKYDKEYFDEIDQMVTVVINMMEDGGQLQKI